jgi:hypothetical protein
MAFTPQCMTLEEFLKNPWKWHTPSNEEIDDSKRALLLPLFDPKDPKHHDSAELLTKMKAEFERQQSIELLKNEIKPSEKTLDPAVVKEMDELAELLYGPS